MHFTYVGWYQTPIVMYGNSMAAVQVLDGCRHLHCSTAAWLCQSLTASLEISELLTVCCFTVASSHLPGLRKCDLGHLGVPTAEEYSRMYCGHMGVGCPENWNFYMAFAFFRLAAMLQRLHKHSLTGEEPNNTSPVLHRSPARAQTCEHWYGERSHTELGEVGTGSICCRV